MTAPDVPAADGPTRRKTRTLWWLLGVLLIGLLLAAGVAVGISWWQRISRNEERAMGACLAYAEGQVMCRSPSWLLPYTDYCHPYTRLYTRKGRSGAPMMLIDKAFVAARGPDGAPRYGYLFLDMKTVGGKPINWVEDYALCATPAEYGVTGRRTFIITTDGTVWAKDLGRREFVKDFPAKPRAAGWEIAP